MLPLKTSNNKLYKSLGLFLKRLNIENSYALSFLLIDKLAKNKKIGWNIITSDDLKDKKIVPSKKYPTVLSWRNDMIKSGILICMATFEELNSNEPNFKANKFKPGEKIEKYINKAINDNIFGVLEKFENKIEEKFENIDSKFDAIDVKFEKMSEMLLMAIPPDNEKRRSIIKENFHDVQKCLSLLKKTEKMN